MSQKPTDNKWQANWNPKNELICAIPTSQLSDTMRTASGLLAWSLWLCAVHGAPAPKSSGSDGLCAAAMLKVGLHPVIATGYKQRHFRL